MSGILLSSLQIPHFVISTTFLSSPFKNWSYKILGKFPQGIVEGEKQNTKMW